MKVRPNGRRVAARALATVRSTGAAIVVGAALLVPAPHAQAAGKGNAGPDPTQFARGATAWRDNCARCHNLRSPKEFTDRRWDIIVEHMRVIAPLPGQVARDIKAFLKASN